MGLALGEILSRTGPGSQRFEPRTSRAHGAITPSDIAAAIATVKNRSAMLLVEAKYISQAPEAFDIGLLTKKYHKSCNHCLRRADTVAKLAKASLEFFINAPRCRRCLGCGQEWDREALRFLDCKLCSGYGGRYASTREIARLSGMSRSKLKKSHVQCFWEMWQILSIWEDVAAAQIKQALRR